MISNLQFLRAFASINVVYFHTLIGSESYGKSTNIFQTLGGWGANGVDIFFVISGFVMIYSQIHNPKKIYEFYISRLIRIVPVYWLITIFLVTLYYLLPEIFKSFSLDLKKIISSLFFVSQIITGEFPVINVGWTLEWEILFYLIFGLSLYFKDIKKTIISIFFFMMLIFLFTEKLLFLEFFVGVLIGYVHNKIKLSYLNGLIILIIGIIFLFLSLSSYIVAIELDRFFIWGIPSAFIVMGAVYCKPIKNSFLFYLGNASYSIYLVQILTVPGFYKLINYFKIEINNDLLSILCLFSSVIFGCFFYSFVEKNLKINKKVTKEINS